MQFIGSISCVLEGEKPACLRPLFVKNLQNETPYKLENDHLPQQNWASAISPIKALNFERPQSKTGRTHDMHNMKTNECLTLSIIEN